jgi:hypothetical protein
LPAAIGTGRGRLGGLAYTEIARTSDFEGYSGFVVGFWLLAGIILGMIAGPLVGPGLFRRR